MKDDPLRVLIVDDDEEIRDLLRALLDKAGYPSAAARDGIEAVERLRRDRFDVAVLDLNMPRMGGIEAMREMKKLRPELEVIIITGFGTEQAAGQAVAQGALAYLVKPFNSEELTSLLPTVREKIRLRALVGEARKTSELKDEMLGITLHDLKSPLTVIVAMSDFLLSRPLDPPTQKGLIKISRMANKMTELIRRLLGKDVVDLEDIHLDRRPTNAADWIVDVLKDLALVARRRKIRFLCQNRLPARSMIHVDRTMLEEIVTNLVGNAVKYCREGDMVRVIVDHSGADFVLTVKDNGPGIEAADQEGIFEKFRRGRTAQGEGSGYGLAIVKRFVELHGGRVSLSSKAGQGAAFTVVLPKSVLPAG